MTRLEPPFDTHVDRMQAEHAKELDMARQTATKQWAAALGSMSWPVLIGAACCSLFYVAVNQGPLKTPFMYRYFASHPVLYVETCMFFVGLAALVLKFADLILQSSSLQRIVLPVANKDAVHENCERLVKYLDGLPNSLRQGYLAQRFYSVFEFVSRRGNTEGLNDELKYLADQDAVRQQESYSLVRIVAWATPMLGFLGTVVGITQALGGIDPKLFATDINAAMQGLLAGLYVAFDTTALALVLSMFLMFVLYFEDRIETQLLNSVDAMVNAEVGSRFQADSGPGDPHLKAVEKMSAAVIKTTETLIRQQTEQWRVAMEETNTQLSRVAQATGEQVKAAIGESLDHSLQNHAERLARFEYEADQQMRARWEQWQAALADNVRVVKDQQVEVAKQTELITKLAQATGEISSLEKTLNDNLHALSGSKNFEDTVLSLSAAIQLLSVKLSHLPDRASQLDLRSNSQGKAA